VEVENFEDFAGNLVLPMNELWIVGQNAGRLTYYGQNANVQQLPRPAFYVRWETARQAGMLLYGIGRGPPRPHRPHLVAGWSASTRTPASARSSSSGR
jgi:hypothetical protein